MRKKEITKQVLRISNGIFSSLIDLILWNAFFFIEVSLSGSPAKVRKAAVLADRDFWQFNSATIKRALAKARMRGYIKEGFSLTKEGKERLESFLPKYFGKRKWDGNWYLVIYDIPESKKMYREILRGALKRLGFGQLQRSVLVSPFNFFGDIERIIKDYKLSSYVILAITNRLGREEARILAERVWKIEKINTLYKNLLKEAKEKNKKELVFKYLSILSQDPQLPEELLLEDWRGEEAFQIFKEFRP